MSGYYNRRLSGQGGRGEATCRIFDIRFRRPTVGVAFETSPRPARSCSSIGQNLRTSLVPANAPSPRAAGAPHSSSLHSRCQNMTQSCGGDPGALTSNCTCMHIRQMDRSIRCVPTCTCDHGPSESRSSFELECKRNVF